MYRRMVVIAPGPVSMGIAIGNTAMFSLWVAADNSSDVMLSLLVLANSISMATRKSRTPPATARESAVMLKNSRIYLPDIAKIIAIMQAITEQRFATYNLSVRSICEVIEIKAITPLMGLTMENIAAKAEMKNVLFEVMSSAIVLILFIRRYNVLVSR
ncbi:hypothetical protein MNV_590010 [Candidatus Methanoperedens nitroreducens]|uniref:Uncharacterized protein n=1 Tax=Candidatus Methanoperedens nitratireducens TaxID=1392998 RepID=A0A284VSB5_9EURY|nr:hypothetical protein MNV_590010 [Candidatus Methanoperedens nitroreducens]